MLCCFDLCKCSCSIPGSFLGTHVLHFMAYFQGEHLDRGRYLAVCFVNKGERLLIGVSCTLGGEIVNLGGEIQFLSVHTSGESCIVRGSCISGGGKLHSEGELHFRGSFELFHALCGLC